MSAFSFQQHVPFVLDFPYLPSVSPFDPPPPSTQPQAGDLASAYSTFFPCYYNPSDAENINIPAETTPVDAGISTVTYNATTTPTPESSSSLERARDVPPRDKVISSPSSSVQPSDVASKTQCSLDKKRKERQRCRSGSTRSKEAREATSRKLRRCSGAAKETKEKKAQKEPPTGYIHVRARRGQATDSHSLAERVRRERIRERMKMLQGLVPGCDKVVGKALLLDEIINYVQFLQNQVEFLSMKLASMNPILYDLGLDSEDHMALPEKLENMSPTLTNVQGTSHIQHTAFPDTTNNYTVPGTSVPVLPHGEGPSCSFLDQDRGSNFAIPVGDRRQSFLNQVKFSHMSSFQ